MTGLSMDSCEHGHEPAPGLADEPSASQEGLSSVEVVSGMLLD